MKKFVQALSTILSRVERVFHIVALVLLLGMMLLGFLDVFLRYVLNCPITGAKETQTIMVPLLVAFAFAITQHNGANTRVELLYEKFPPAMKKVADFIALLPPLAIWVLITWQSVVTGNHYFKTGRVVSMIDLNLGYIQYAAAVGSAILCLEMVRELVQLIMGQGAEGGSDGQADSVEPDPKGATA
jgi:TRAP-type C4-dicarboxylate transport system permease small subunit